LESAPNSNRYFLSPIILSIFKQFFNFKAVFCGFFDGNGTHIIVYAYLARKNKQKRNPLAKQGVITNIERLSQTNQSKTIKMVSY
jgi:hypothetical protein